MTTGTMTTGTVLRVTNQVTRRTVPVVISLLSSLYRE